MLTLFSAFAIPLFAAHVLGDFLFLRKKDEAQGIQIRPLLKHSLMVAVASYLLIGIAGAWLIGTLILLSHALIDYFSARYSKNDLRSFAFDQCAHLLVLLAISAVVSSNSFYQDVSLWARYAGLWFYPLLVIVSGAVLCINAGSLIVSLGVKRFHEQLRVSSSPAGTDLPENEGHRKRGFADGGRVIGCLERALIFLFVMVGQPIAIGFLIAAKSVLRFGEIKEGTNRMEAEYIIIGTLCSFTTGLIVSFLTQAVLSAIK